MNAALLLEHYARIADAPDAIARLRRFVLDLAVRGKLVEQDTSDEPASELLNRIAAERARLAKAGEIRKPKPLPAVDDPVFTLPGSWSWVVIREITSDRGQQVPTAPFTYIDVTAINKEAGFVAEPKVLSAAEAPSRARKITRKGDVIYSCVRPYLLNVAVIEQDFDPAPIASTAFAILNGYGLVLPRYIWIVLRTPFIIECVEETQRGQAYPAINDADFAVLPFPLPPLAEQHRIVAKVDELMALCDQLEAARESREAQRDKLTASSLARLNAPDPETFPADARFALANLAPLTTRADQIKQLRQTILNLAVRGKLVEQNAADEPASAQLTRIGEAKAAHQKAKAGKGNRNRANKITFDEPLPSGWEWSTLAELALTMRYGTSVKCEQQTAGTPVLRIPNVSKGVIDLADMKFGPLSEKEKADLCLEVGDLLLIRSNGSLAIVGRSAVVTEEAAGMAFAGYLVRARFERDEVSSRYLWLVLNGSDIRDAIELPIRSAVGLKNVNLKEFGALKIPLPPLAEQHRIIAKVDELMALCDQLEASLTEGEQTRSRLLESVLHHALEPA